MPFKDFDAARAELEPTEFVLGGHKFVVPIISATAVLSLASKAQTEGVEAVAAFGDFLFTIVDESQHEDLQGALDKLDLAGLLELTTWLMEVATGRPLPSASSSPELASSSSEPSKDDSPSPEENTP